MLLFTHLQEVHVIRNRRVNPEFLHLTRHHYSDSKRGKTDRFYYDVTLSEFCNMDFDRSPVTVTTDSRSQKKGLRDMRDRMIEIQQRAATIEKQISTMLEDGSWDRKKILKEYNKKHEAFLRNR
jgi:hypothetical protein